MSLSHQRRGFTLIEVLIATALLGFSLVVMFGFHAQAARSNIHARKITACTYLAQDQLEELLALPWTEGSLPAALADNPDTTLDSTSSLPNVPSITPVNSGGEGTDANYGEPIYYVSYAVEWMDTAPTWLKINVRCVYHDQRFNTWKATNISTFRYRDS